MSPQGMFIIYSNKTHIPLPLKPGELTFREMSGVALNDVYRFPEADRSIQIIQDFLVSNNGETVIELLTRSKYLLSVSGEKWTDRQKTRAPQIRN